MLEKEREREKDIDTAKKTVHSMGQGPGSFEDLILYSIYVHTSRGEQREEECREKIMRRKQ